MAKKLVAFFSASGVTAQAARTLAEAAGRICTKLRRQFHTQMPIWTG